MLQKNKTAYRISIAHLAAAAAAFQLTAREYTATS